MTQNEDDFRPGVNVAGYLTAESGVGEAARRTMAAVRSAGVPFSTLNYIEGSPSRQQAPAGELSKTGLDYAMNVVCVNANELPGFALHVGPGFFTGRYTAVVWWWEMPVFPRAFHGAFALVDEIWVGSEYVAHPIAKETAKPVLVLPLPIDIPQTSRLGRSDLGLPDDFLFVFSFDFFGSFERKNPVAVVEAFKQAFAPGEGPQLVIKSMNGERWPDDLKRLGAASAGRRDIRVVDGYWSHEEKDALIAACDCYVSLHRAEGFGLGLAEAMSHGKPVIATRYSGNLEFMDDSNSYLVGYRLVGAPPGLPQYPADVPWAEPNVLEAAELMRRVYEERDEAGERGARARDHIREAHSPARAGAFIAERLEQRLNQRVRTTANIRRGWLEAVVGDAVQRAEADLDAANELRTAATRFGAPLRGLRRSLYRGLWPYFFRHRELDAAIIQGIRALHATLADQAQHLEQLEAEIRAREPRG
ncbi:MAG: glycosyltransferase family 4 protein [Actinomycetota bacterium]|nr:glycosyltransferase family 4 protein [Actinomycetota bacterium]